MSLTRIIRRFAEVVGSKTKHLLGHNLIIFIRFYTPIVVVLVFLLWSRGGSDVIPPKVELNVCSIFIF